jgi:hypothetical protein
MSDAPHEHPQHTHDDDEIVVAVGEHPRSPSPAPSLAETVAETVADAKRTNTKRRARKVTAIKSVDFSETLQRVNDTYASMVAGGEPLCILTPPVVLKDTIVDEDGETREYVTIKLKRTYGDLFQDLEDRVLQAAKDRKVTWFQNEDLEDQFLENAMKRFYSPETKSLTVRVDDDIGGRLDVSPGTRVRCVLELNSVVFTRTQFGALWTLTLVKQAARGEDTYLFDPEEEPDHASIAQGDLLTCLTNRELTSHPDETIDVEQ